MSIINGVRSNAPPGQMTPVFATPVKSPRSNAPGQTTLPVSVQYVLCYIM